MKEATNKQERIIGNAEIDKLKNEKEQRDGDKKHSIGEQQR